MPTLFRHDPDAVLDYAFNWTRWLADAETIDAHSVTVVNGEATIGSATREGGIVTVFISDAAEPLVRITCRITTSQGRTDDRTITLRVRNR